MSPKIDGQKLSHLFGFSTTSRHKGKYLLNETWHGQSGKGEWKYKGSTTALCRPKVSWTLVPKRHK